MTGADEPPRARYRRLADQCLDMLSTTSDPRARVSLLELAQTWTRLAQECEAMTPKNASALQPATQQQQQIQPKEPAQDDQ
jgi:hypothetical protein